MSDKRTGKKKKKLRPAVTQEPSESGQTVPNKNPQKANKSSQS